VTEKELISLIQAKDEAAFRQLVERHQHMVYNTALGLLQNAGDAEDTAQEVFIQVYKSAHQFRGESSISTWLYKITVTKSLDLIRSKKRKKRFAFVTGLFGHSGEQLYDAPDLHHPGVVLDKKEDAALLFSMIAKLPETQKTAFILNKLEGLAYAEIAAIMEISESAVDSLLQRARQNLKKTASQITNGP
jgi:RNA polymerase sigma factor (sigma-70 family)